MAWENIKISAKRVLVWSSKKPWFDEEY